MARTQIFGFKGPGGTIMGLSANLVGSMPGMISMTVVDGAGFSSDTMTAEFDNRNMMVNPPRKGVTVQPFGGYVEGPMQEFGDYIVDQVTFSGYPHKISISAQAAAAKSGAKQRQAKGYPKKDFPTVKSVAADIAGEAGLQLSISGEIGSLPNDGEFRSEEEALHFLQRVVSKFDATVTVKSGRMVVVPRGKGMSASGLALPVAVVGPGVILSYTVSEGDKVQHEKSEAAWYDRPKNEVVIENESTGLEGPPLRVQPTFQTKATAKAAAKAKANQLKRQTKNGQFTVDGNPSYKAEQLITVSGLPQICNGSWRVKTATHTFSASAPYTTALDCEVPT
jgi:uncharacterized protein